MIVDSKKIIRFLELLALKGNLENSEAVALGDANGLHVVTVLPNSVVAYKGTLNGSFGDLGTVGLDNIQLLKKFANMFKTSKEINMVLDKNRINFTASDSRTETRAILRDITLIRNALTNDQFVNKSKASMGNEFVLTKDMQTEIIKHYEVLGSKELVIIGKDNKIYLELDSNKNQVLTNFDVESKISDFNIVISDIFVDLVATLNEDVTVSMKTNHPIYISLSEEDIKFEFLVAPKVK